MIRIVFIKEKFINFYAREKNNFIWTVEHVLPQGENLPKEWVDMIALGDTEKAQQIKKMYVHKLGNLTLTGYNSKLSNLALNKKQDRKDSSGKYVGYKNGLTINEVLKDTEKWSKEDIEKRTNDLVNRAIDLFKL